MEKEYRNLGFIFLLFIPLTFLGFYKPISFYHLSLYLLPGRYNFLEGPCACGEHFSKVHRGHPRDKGHYFLIFPNVQLTDFR